MEYAGRCNIYIASPSDYTHVSTQRYVKNKTALALLYPTDELQTLHLTWTCHLNQPQDFWITQCVEKLYYQLNSLFWSVFYRYIRPLERVIWAQNVAFKMNVSIDINNKHLDVPLVVLLFNNKTVKVI